MHALPLTYTPFDNSFFVFHALFYMLKSDCHILGSNPGKCKTGRALWVFVDRKRVRGWRDDPAVHSTGCSSKEPGIRHSAFSSIPDTFFFNSTCFTEMLDSSRIWENHFKTYSLLQEEIVSWSDETDLITTLVSLLSSTSTLLIPLKKRQITHVTNHQTPQLGLLLADSLRYFRKQIARLSRKIIWFCQIFVLIETKLLFCDRKTKQRGHAYTNTIPMFPKWMKF